MVRVVRADARMIARGRGRLLPTCLAVVALAAACSSGGSDGSTSGGSGTATTTTRSGVAAVAAPGTYAVGSHSFTWVDETRSTNANKTEPAKPDRTLPAYVVYPANGTKRSDRPVVDAPPSRDGPFPLILFSHGVTSRGPEYTASLQVLASAGYVVVAPTYPLSNRGTPGGAVVTDMPNQAEGDVPFLLDQALAASEQPDGPISGLIDPERIGLAGHSLGAVTSLTAGYDPCCVEDRVDAVAEWSGILVPLTRPYEVAEVAEGRPILIVHGEQDRTVPYGSADGVWRRLGAPKVEVSLPGEGHVPAFVVGEGTEVGKVVVDTTVFFFDRFLKGDDEGVDRIERLVDDAGDDVATVRVDLG